MATKTTKPSKKKVESKTPKYNPQKNYRWNEDDEFILKGSEFGLMYNLLKSKAAESQAIIEAFQALHKLFEAGVEEGTITEIELPEQEKE